MASLKADELEQRPQGCLGQFLRLFGIRVQPTEESAEAAAAQPLPYQLTQRFLSPAELSFYKVLTCVLPTGFTIVVKSRMVDVLFVPRGAIEKKMFENFIGQKHMDFLICESQTITPRLAIELDDKSHDRQDRRERDEFVDKAVAVAGLKLLHIEARAS